MQFFSVRNRYGEQQGALRVVFRLVIVIKIFGIRIEHLLKRDFPLKSVDRFMNERLTEVSIYIVSAAAPSGRSVFGGGPASAHS
jgi:hypothetical protein